MSQTNRCPECGAELPPSAPRGLCPACLLKRGLETNTAGFTAEGASASRWMPPQLEELAARFPELEIVRLIGRGGMGAVYQARQKNLDRAVALKILPPEMGNDPAFAERFAREAQAMARLNHPHIVTIYEFGQRAGWYFFVMEYVDGVNLRGLLDSGHVSSKEALVIVPQICDALQYAHDQGIVHRDIKPENILLNKQGQVKIADFGLAKLMGRTPTEASFRPERVMGTPQYMAPEQIDHPTDVDHRADIYSLGVVFYQMLTGELPVGQFAPPSKKVQIDVRLDEIVLRALEREPEKRYQQVSQVKTEVETIAGTSAMAMPATERGDRSGRGFEYRSRHTLLGIPWLHIAYGIDPLTKRPRTARGIVAMGDKAIGFLAMGIWAYGILASGATAVGVFAFGGCALGIVAFGGFTFALFAFGGFVLGLYGMGGVGWGPHVITSLSRDHQHAQILMHLFLEKHQLLFFGITFGLSFGMPLLYMKLNALGRRLAGQSDQTTSWQQPRFKVVSSGSGTTVASSSYRRGRRRKVFWAIFIAGVLALYFRPFVFETYFVAGNAVSPEVPAGSRVLVYKLAHAFSPGDIVLYRDDPQSQNRLARVVQAGPVKGKLQVQRGVHGEPFELAAQDVVGLVILNTRTGGINPEPAASAAPALPEQAQVAQPSDTTPEQSEDLAETVSAQPPVVVKTDPPSGIRDIAPGIADIRVTFSKKMTDGSWSWCTAWANSMPPIIGQPRYDSDHRTATLQVKLEPGETYGFWLNSENFHNFQDTSGRPAIPYLLIFQTRQNPTSKE